MNVADVTKYLSKKVGSIDVSLRNLETRGGVVRTEHRYRYQILFEQQKDIISTIDWINKETRYDAKS